MATTLHIGKKRVQTITTSDGSVLATGAVNVAVDGPYVTATVNPTTNEVTVTGVGAGGASVIYSAAGYQSVSEAFIVSPLPTLVVTDGPEVLA